MNYDIFRKELCHISNPVGYPEILKHFKQSQTDSYCNKFAFCCVSHCY